MGCALAAKPLYGNKLKKEKFMASFEELAKSYVNELKSAPNKKNAVKSITESVDGLTYSITKKPITKDDKKKIIELIISTVQGDIMIKEADNKEYLAMLNQILQQLND